MFTPFGGPVAPLEIQSLWPLEMEWEQIVPKREILDQRWIPDGRVPAGYAFRALGFPSKARPYDGVPDGPRSTNRKTMADEPGSEDGRESLSRRIVELRQAVVVGVS